MKKDQGHFSQKHSPDRKMNEHVARAVREKAKGRELTCAQAFDITKKLEVTPEEVGFTVDRLEIAISRCQLGLFGYSPISRIIKSAETVSNELENAIRASLIDNRLPCTSAWEIAGKLRIARIKVCSACEALKIKISRCQLGAF
jgi:PIN domain nuclease of toxin-antitoxin system